MVIYCAINFSEEQLLSQICKIPKLLLIDTVFLIQVRCLNILYKLFGNG